MNTKQIISEYLLNNGFDALYNSAIPCSCTLDDLICCEENCDECEPAYKVKCRAEDCTNTDCENKEEKNSDYCITKIKPKVSGD